MKKIILTIASIIVFYLAQYPFDVNAQEVKYNNKSTGINVRYIEMIDSIVTFRVECPIVALDSAIKYFPNALNQNNIEQKKGFVVVQLSYKVKSIVLNKYTNTNFLWLYIFLLENNIDFEENDWIINL